MTTRNLLRSLFLLPLLAGPLAALADPVYAIHLLPQDFAASAINNAGHVVGTGSGGAAIWNGSTLSYLSGLAPGSEGLGINNHDDVVGQVGARGFVVAAGVVQTIDSEPFRSWASGINDAGRVVGTVRQNDQNALSLGFVWVGGSLSTILTFGGYTDFANAINSAGQVAGTASRPTTDFGDPQRNAFLADLLGNVSNLGSLGGPVSEANDLNDAAQVVGWSQTALAGEERPFLYASAAAGMIDLGSLGGRAGRANGINNAGMVVGMSDIGDAAALDYHAFLYRDGQMVDLNTLIDPATGWRLVSAADINDQQQILATACQGSSSTCRSVLLDLIPAVPEPGTWLMLLAGLALLAGRACRAHWRKWGKWRKWLWLPLLGAPLAALAEPTYSVTFLPADFFASTHMNNAGQIAGSNLSGAAIWSSAGVSDIGATAPGSSGYAINNRGDLAGANGADPFSYTQGVYRNLGRLGIWDSGQASAINDAGQVAGNAYYVIGERARGWVYANGVMRNIPTMGGDWSWASAINNAGQVAGIATIDSTDFIDPTRHAIVFQDGVTRDLGTLGGLISEANDINDAGQVVGMSETTPNEKSGQPHPFIYQDGVMTDLGFLGNGLRGTAYGINGAGAVVGASEWSDAENDFHAFLYANHAMVDLNSLIDPVSDWRLVSARDINDARQILAIACRPGECATVRLDLISAVPEPRAWAMLLVGLLVVGSLRRSAQGSAAFS
ncbi:MAG: PEP-CTERM sorting domain-containing protein [Pseudomonadota bacterium]|nr:PEP-CTERM sorting domain-containing protein [Pseudomonadota bacterium]